MDRLACSGGDSHGLSVAATTTGSKHLSFVDKSFGHSLPDSAIQLGSLDRLQSLPSIQKSYNLQDLCAVLIREINQSITGSTLPPTFCVHRPTQRITT